MSTISISGTTNVDVDFEEEVEIEDLTDKELLECVKEAVNRKLLNNDGMTPEREYTMEAYQELLGNRRHSAIALLERALWPSTAAFKAPIDVMNAFHKGKAP